MKKRKIYIAYTGGTIGMKQSEKGWIPEAGFMENQIRSMPEFHTDDIPDFHIDEFDPLLDSANMAPPDWVKIAQAIKNVYQEYDGFVVLHGTDTMSYTASALAFMLEGLQKPVILTGSLIPLQEPRNDARDNLLTSLLIAANFRIPEVCIFFDNELYRGCRSVKIDSNHFHGFDSPNYPPLATAGLDVVLNDHLIRRMDIQRGKFKIHTQMDCFIGVLWLFPGITGEVVENFLKPPLKGVVLLAFGVGNGPGNNEGFIRAIREASERGVVIVDCTPCLKGTVDLNDYETGSHMAEAGVISGYDMTPEAALTKLFYLFGKGYKINKIKELVQKDLRGELTRRRESLLSG